ncbi:hypothetical protein OSTOST_18603 [Ostertagia ostertagi]
MASEVLWRSSISTDSLVGGFCVDSDDSILYTTKPHGIYRIGVTPIKNVLTEPEADDPFATLLSSPRKLISHGASQITQKGFAFLNNAVSTAKDIGANSDVPYILEDAWNKMNIKDDLGSLLQNVVDIVDQADDGTFFTQRDEVRPSTVSRLPDHAYEAIEEPVAINVVRKEKGVRRKRLSHSESHEISDSHYDDTISIDENTLLALTKASSGRTPL